MKQLENEGSGRWGVKAQSLDEAVPTPKWSSLPPEPKKEEPKYVKKNRYYYFDTPGLGCTGRGGCPLVEQPPQEIQGFTVVSAAVIAYRLYEGTLPRVTSNQQIADFEKQILQAA